MKRSLRNRWHAWRLRTMWKVCGVSVLSLGLTVPLFADPPPAATVTTPGVEIRVEPLMALHSWVRQLAEAKGEPEKESGVAEAVAVVRRIEGELGGWQGWGIVDGVFVGVKGSAELARIVPELPEELALLGGSKFHLRAALRDLAAAYGALEPRFLAQTWPAWKKDLDRNAAELKSSFVPKLPQVWADVGRHLDLAAPKEPVPVYLVYRAPFPGAVTFRSQTGPAVAVSLISEPRELYEEMVVHELLHALDVLASGENVLIRLRSRLGALPGASPRTVHDFVHTLMFAQAAGTTRAVFDPKHRDYGDLAGYYPKVPEATAVVVPAWRSYLEGKTTRDAALDQIASGFAAKPAEKTKGDPKAAPTTNAGFGGGG